MTCFRTSQYTKLNCHNKTLQNTLFVVRFLGAVASATRAFLGHEVKRGKTYTCYALGLVASLDLLILRLIRRVRRVNDTANHIGAIKHCAADPLLFFVLFNKLRLGQWLGIDP